MYIYTSVDNLIKTKEAALSDNRKVVCEGCFLYDDNVPVQAFAVGVYTWTGSEWTLMNNYLCLTKKGVENFIKQYTPYRKNR